MAKLSEKVGKIIENEEISVFQMEKTIGASKGVLSKFLASGTDIQSKWVIKIAEKYPKYSAEWLLRDIEPMIINTEQSFSFSNSGAGAMVNGVNNGTVQKNEGDCQECALLKAKDETIAAQKVTIEALSKR